MSRAYRYTPFLPAGNINPMWDATRLSQFNDCAALDAATLNQMNYQIVCDRDTDSVRVAPIHCKLVTVKNVVADKINQYLAYYVPSRTFVARSEGFPYDAFANYNQKGDFDGLVFYTTLSAQVVAVDRYVNGSVITGYGFTTPSLQPKCVLSFSRR